MKKSVWGYKKSYILMVAVIVITAIGLSFACQDISKNASEVAEKNLNGNTELLASYFDDHIEGCLTQLQQLAQVIGEPVYKESADDVTGLLRDYKREFSSLSVLTVQGALEFGDRVIVSFDQDNMLRKLIYDKEPVVYSDAVHDRNDEDVILLAVPFERNGKVDGIVVGTVAIKSLNEIMDDWGSSKEGCAFLISHRGSFITRGQKYNEILGGKANSFFTYLTKCELTGEFESASDIEREAAKGDPVSFRHRYGGKEYLTVLRSSEYGGWYLGFVESASAAGSAILNVKGSTKVCMILALGLCIILLGIFVVLNYREHGYRDTLERYFILEQMDQSVVFEFQFEPKRFRVFGDTMRMFGIENRMLCGEEVYDVYQYIHEDDRSVRGRIHRFYDDDTRQFTAEVRIKNAVEGEYSWFRIAGMLVKDARYGINLKFVGRIESADQQIAEEKNLVQRAENDLLTGVLNKKTMEEKVINCLQNITGNIHYIFFMVDLDNFKNVNDKLGHIYGDNAIVDTAKYLTEIFEKNGNAFVGRLGGDEFAVCAAYDAFDEESLLDYIKKKADRICEVNRRTYKNGGVSVNITSSVGIAIAPDFAEDFETIYKMADSALYRSKNGGKNCYHIYKEGAS